MTDVSASAPETASGPGPDGPTGPQPSVSPRPGLPPVRRVRADDGARWRALRMEMLADSPLAFLETLADAAARPHREYAAWVAAMADGTRSAAFVAEVDGRFVGHAGGHVAPGQPHRTIVFAVYLTPAWRGSGLLGALVESVAAWSRAASRPELMLEVVVGNDRAVRAYERLGFVDSGVRVPHPTVPVLRELQMVRAA